MTIDELCYTSALYMDLEWNCWDGPPPPSHPMEIIEIGLVELDLKSLAILREAAYLIRPRRLEISRRCTRITGIEQQDLKNAPRFPVVLEQLIRDFNPCEKLCCVWGNDLEIFAKACGTYRLRTPFHRGMDLSQVVWDALLLRERPSVKSAVQRLELPFDGVAHTALADARNTAHVHAELLRRIRSGSDHMMQPIPTINTQTGISEFGAKLLSSLSQGE